MKILSAPLDICLGITNKCNLNCRHCLASDTRQAVDFSTEELLGIIRQIEELKIFSLAIFGGEPLVRKDFFQILDALCKIKFLKPSLNTNGTLITKEVARKLASYPISGFAVSLDGSTAQVQDPLRGKGSFAKNIEGIENLISQRRHVLISVTASRFNYQDASNIVRLAKKLGASQVRFNELMFVGNASCYHESLLMSPKQKFELLSQLKSLRDEFGGFVTGSILQVVDIMQEMKGKPKEKFPLKIHSCGAGVKKCNIRPDGWVTPCEVLWGVKAGNLRESSLYDIWHNSEVMNDFRKTIEITEKEIPVCKDCQYLRLCYKGHRCQPYYYPGEPFAHKELYCWREDVVSA
ncbi:MAG TPA: radical SAM protein [Candidatus Margulisiibacteriota bacterium]|nr:radical SAM protein [Candidatus Margulisiibacteriota bacterium]